MTQPEQIPTPVLTPVVSTGPVTKIVRLGVNQDGTRYQSTEYRQS